jgi:hypothetical protein
VEDERACDDERRPGVEAVVAPDGDAEERRRGRQGRQEGKRGPLVRADVARDDGGDRGDGRCQADDGDVERGGLGQAAHTPGLPPCPLRHHWDAGHLPHLVKVRDVPHCCGVPPGDRQRKEAAVPQLRYRRLRRIGESSSPVRGCVR